MTAAVDILRPKFDLDDAQRAFDAWGCNCGPGAIAAIADVTLETARDWIGREEFARKRYTNPTMMIAALKRSGVLFTPVNPLAWPEHGLVRIQWEGPWTEPGANPRWAYQHTHWIGSHDRGAAVFDINCMSVGGWVTSCVWAGQLVPWLLRETCPRANGKWHMTHAIEVRPGKVHEGAVR